LLGFSFINLSNHNPSYPSTCYKDKTQNHKYFAHIKYNRPVEMRSGKGTQCDRAFVATLLPK